jgi:hypothetical protein
VSYRDLVMMMRLEGTKISGPTVEQEQVREGNANRASLLVTSCTIIYSAEIESSHGVPKNAISFSGEPHPRFTHNDNHLILLSCTQQQPKPAQPA